MEPLLRIRLAAHFTRSAGSVLINSNNGARDHVRGKARMKLSDAGNVVRAAEPERPRRTIP
jgi:hypothetical protein